MQYRKDALASNECYHIFSRSIAKFIIFNNSDDFARFMEILELFQYQEFEYTYTNFKRLTAKSQNAILLNLQKESPKLVHIISYCLMPTHVHLVLKQVVKNGISKYMARVLNSYSKYFNTKYHRKGPLWEGRFKNVLVKNDEQLLHLTRYQHLNPTSAGIIKDPFRWAYSSLNEYVDPDAYPICEFKDLIDMSPARYRKFILNQKDYQKTLALIKGLLIDNCSG